MSHLSKVFNSVPIKIPDRSGFDLSHENIFSAKVGTLIPASVEEVLPGDVVSIGGSMSVELPPLATNFKGRVDAKLEAFFVPNRILWAGWQDFICQDPNHKPVVPGFSVSSSIPQVRLSKSIAGPGSLADYLGVKYTQNATASQTLDVNALPFLAYAKIHDDWYRDTLVQQPFFVDGISNGQFTGTATINACALPFQRDGGILRVANAGYASGNSVLGFNGVDLRSLRQRCFAKDYYTTMTTQPQSGADSSLQFNVQVDTSDQDGNGVGSFNIRSLRVANALQTWLERNNIGGTRYYDQILAHYGVMPPDANVNRAILLGAVTSPVVVNSISQTNQTTDNSTAGQPKNPYANTTGAQFGRGLSFGKDTLVDNFEVKEHGFIMILFSLVPHVYYGTGSRRYLGRSGSGTFAFPEFAGIGDQEVYASELDTAQGFAGGILWDSRFISGYNQRYSEYKYHDDEVHGLLSDGNPLDSFVLQRGFSGIVQPSTDLLEIPTNYMDNVMVTTSGISGFNAIVDCYFDSKFLRVLPEYSLPHL